jgi:hypothetical protein
MQQLPETKGKPIKQELFEEQTVNESSKIKGWDYMPSKQF